MGCERMFKPQRRLGEGDWVGEDAHDDGDVVQLAIRNQVREGADQRIRMARAAGCAVAQEAFPGQLREGADQGRRRPEV